MRALPLWLLLLAAAPAGADPCKTAEPALRKITRELTGVFDHANTAVVTCGLRGANEPMIAKLTAEVLRVSADEEVATKWSSCVINPSGQTLLGLVAQKEAFVGERVEAAKALCVTRTNIASGCMSIEYWLSNVAAVVDRITAEATELAVTCALTGANDAALDQLASKARREIATQREKTPEVNGCHMAPTEAGEMLRGLATTLGEQLGYTFVQCSSKAHARFAQLARKGPVTPAIVNADPVIQAESKRVMGSVFGDN